MPKTSVKSPACPKCGGVNLSMGCGNYRGKGNAFLVHGYRCRDCGTAGELWFAITFSKATVGAGGVSERIPPFHRSIDYSKYGKPGCDPFAESSKNLRDLEAMDAAAKKKKSLVGRYITEPHADGSAFYLITEDLGDQVRIEVCTGIGDDWVLPAYGEEHIIEKEYVLRKLRWRDDSPFSRKAR